jgi:Vesicle coat trafficking protein Sec16 mid-region
MASQQDGPPVDEGPIPFFSGPDDKDPFGSLQQAAAPPQPKQTLPSKQESTPNAGNAMLGDASALFGNAPAQNQPIFSPSTETYQPSPAIDASPFGGQTYSGSNNDSFFDQTNPSSFFDAPAQSADATSHQQYGHSEMQHGNQQVPTYGTPLQQGYSQHDAYQQVPSADQSYDQQQYAYGNQYDQGSAVHSHQQPAGYSYEQENTYTPHNQQHQQQPNDAYEGYTHSAYDPASYQQPQQQASYDVSSYFIFNQYEGSTYAKQQQPYGQHNQEQPPASHDPYAPQDYSTPVQQQQPYDSSTYANQQQPYAPQQKEQPPVNQDAYTPQSFTAPEQQQQQPYDPSSYFNQQQSHQPQPTEQQAPSHDQQQQQYDPAAYSEHHQQQYDSEAYSEHQQSYDPSQQQQFDPNVHYYYDEAGQVHYYDPNTNQEYDFSQYDYSQQYSYDPNHVGTETGDESLDKAHVQDQGQQETPASFEQPVQDLQAGQEFVQLGDVAPHTESADVPVSYEEPVSQYAPTQFSQQGNGHSYFDEGQSYNPDIGDNFVTETTPDTGDLDDLVLGGEQSAQAPPPETTAPPPASVPPPAAAPPSAVAPPPKAAPFMDDIPQPSEESTAAPAELSMTEDNVVPEFTADESGDVAESSFNEDSTSYHYQDISSPQRPMEDPSSLMSSLNLPPLSHPPTEQPAHHGVDPQESMFRRDSTRSSQHENAAMDMHTSHPPVSQYTPTEPPRSVQSSLSPPPSLSAFSVSALSINSPGLFPCPDPECQGENPSKAKFCCECGRQLAALSRSPTPAVSGQQPNRTYSNDSSAYYPQGDAQTLPQSYVPSLPNQHVPRSGSPLTTVATPHDPYTSQGYYGAENYDPYQQQYGNNDQQYAGQYDEQYNQQYDEQYNQQYDQQYGDQQYGEYGMVDQPAEAEPAINDPLNRTQGCPIAVFGFGGKLCLMFPHTVQRYSGGYGADNNFAPTQSVVPGDVKIRNIKDVLTITDSNTVADLANFIGPLVMDSKVGSKMKKKDAIKYTSERVEFLKALMQDLQGDKEKMFLESRILLWRVVKAALEIDGPLVDK